MEKVATVKHHGKGRHDSIPVRLKRERILHMHACECIHRFQHFEVYKKIHPHNGEVEDMINKEVINHDSF